MRSRRIRSEERKMEWLVASARHAALGMIEMRVENLSLNGAALVLVGAGPGPGLVAVGDRLERVRIGGQDSLLCEGDATVRRIAPQGMDLLLGIELRSGAIDFSLFYRLEARRGFSARLESALKPEAESFPIGFEAWVDGQRAALERLESFLDAEERALEDMDLLTRRETIGAYLEEIGPRLAARMNAASLGLRRLVSALPKGRHPGCIGYYRQEMHHLILQSPFMKRAYVKPLGYPGDYEMMNMLYRDHAEGASLFAKAMNLFAAREMAAQAKINRVDYLGARIREAIGARGGVRLASVGCGPAREIGMLLEENPELGRHLEATLIDQEERVILYCERTLSPLAARTGARLRFVRESVRRLLGAGDLKDSLGECDLIYSAGLFDYLRPGSFSALLAGLYSALAPGGHLCVGNVGSHNPTRHTMEYLLDWFLIHRSASELEEFARALEPRPARIEVDAEPTGVNLFLRIWR